MKCVLFGLVMAVVVSASEESDLEWYRKKQLTQETGRFDATRMHVLRLGPGEDILECLYRYSRVLQIGAASVVSTVGSLNRTNIRYANQADGEQLTGHFEIVSLTGNIDMQSESLEVLGSGHLHIAVATETGGTIGGHLLTGNTVYTTAEITIVELNKAQFYRAADDAPGGSGYYELKVRHDQGPV